MHSIELDLAVGTGDAEVISAGFFSPPQFVLSQVQREFIIYSPQGRATTLQFFRPFNALSSSHLHKFIELRRKVRFVKLGNFAWPQYTAAIMSGNSQAVKRFYDHISYGFNTHVVVEDLEDVFWFNITLVSQPLFLQSCIDLFPYGSVITHKLVDIFQGSVAAVADGD